MDIVSKLFIKINRLQLERDSAQDEINRLLTVNRKLVSNDELITKYRQTTKGLAKSLDAAELKIKQLQGEENELQA